MKLTIFFISLMLFKSSAFAAVIDIHSLDGRSGKSEFFVDNEHSDAGACRITVQSNSKIQIEHNMQNADHAPTEFSFTGATMRLGSQAWRQEFKDGALPLCGRFSIAKQIRIALNISEDAVEIAQSYNCSAGGFGEPVVYKTRCEYAK